MRYRVGSSKGRYPRQRARETLREELAVEDIELKGHAVIYWHKNIGEYVVMLDGKFIGYLQ